MPTFDLEFEVYCAECNEGLCNNCETTITRTRQMPRLNVQPCERCLEKAKEEGRESGYEEGRQEGYDEASMEKG